MKAQKFILWTIATVIAVAAIVAVVVVFSHEISEFLIDVKDRIAQKKDEVLHADEYTDYADV
jgi:undecaprenyl pyrophosphate phosphatase UppP